jgi:uncharacterized protein
MFPLGTVLFPSVYLPLHVFEPRYRALVRHCLDADREFGVVLIERGSEVGGGDHRSLVGTVARIIEAVELDDGRWALGTVGVRRVKVQRWLDDDPYPRAEVDDWPDDTDANRDEQLLLLEPPDLAARLEQVAGQLRRVLATGAEMGDRVADSTLELADDPELASYQIAAVGPFGPADQHRLLAVPSTADRLDALAAMLSEAEEDLGRRLLLDGPDPDDL